MFRSKSPAVLAAWLASMSLSFPALAQSSSPAPEAGAPQAAQPASPAEKEPVRKTTEWNIDKKTRVAIEGYDPVAYFPEGGSKATKGDEKITVDYKGVVYRFANEEHKKLFLASPAKYEPVCGGWCAWAMQDGEKVEVDPKSFIVKDGRLFLFYDGFLADTRSKWMKGDHNAEASKVDANWKKATGEEPRKPSATTPAQPAAPTTKP